MNNSDRRAPRGGISHLYFEVSELKLSAAIA